MSPPEITPLPSVYDAFHQASHTQGATPINLTIGNPHLKPPASYYRALAEVVRELQQTPENGHGYLTADDPFGLCEKLAAELARRFGAPFTAPDILPSVGATGAIDVALKTLVRPLIAPEMGRGEAARVPDEVIVVAPYFVEYLNLIRANGAIPVVVDSGPAFDLDVRGIAHAVGPRTRALIVNSPNNPTGRIYPEETLRALAEALEARRRDLGCRVVVIEDAVYDCIVFTEAPAPSMVPCYPAVIRVNSYSKSLSLSGERLGYLAVHPDLAPAPERARFMADLRLNTRMRVVHPPLLQQRVVARLSVSERVDVAAYRRNVERLHDALAALGFGVRRPEGTFYLWAVLPPELESEEEFRELASRPPSPLLYLPGALFGGEGARRCIRLSACVSPAEIDRACVRLSEIVRARRPSAPG